MSSADSKEVISMSSADSKIDRFIEQSTTWQPIIRRLRRILLDCGLTEELKWGKPCFHIEGKNVAIIQPFKAHCALMFFKGVLLDDPRGLLRRQGNNTRAAMRLEFTSEAQVKKTVVGAYVRQAIAAEKSGRAVAFAAKHELDLPAELAEALRKDRKLKRAFDALTPGRKRSHALHISGAKQAATRARRVMACAPKILAGRGFNER